MMNNIMDEFTRFKTYLLTLCNDILDAQIVSIIKDSQTISSLIMQLVLNCTPDMMCAILEQYLEETQSNALWTFKDLIERTQSDGSKYYCDKQNIVTIHQYEYVSEYDREQLSTILVGGRFKDIITDGGRYFITITCDDDVYIIRYDDIVTCLDILLR